MSNNKIKVDFRVIESRSPRYLMIGDTSFWAYAKNKPSYISIKLPASRKYLTFTFNKNSINTFNSHTLGLSCLRADCQDEEYIDLPDGIYEICVKSGYEGIEKLAYYLKTDRFEVELAKTIIKSGLEYSIDNKMFRDAILDIKWYLIVAKSWTVEGDFVKADYWFNKSKKALEKLRNCKDCN